MFKVVPEILVWWPVLFAGVTEDGAVIENKIELRFRILDEDAIDDFARTTNLILAGKQEADDADKAPVDRPTPSVLMQRGLMPIVSDWRLVAGANGEAWPFNEANFATLLRVPNVFPSILSAYADCRAGRAEVRAGN
jgi:hypothetical protein